MSKRTRKSISHVDFFFEDWLAGTATCTPDQRSVLITICSLIWSSNGRLADNDQVLARLNNMSTRRYRKVKSELLGMQKLWVEDGCIFQERALFALENALKVKELAQKNGAKGGRKNAENFAKLRKNNETGGSDPTLPATSEKGSERGSSHPHPHTDVSSTSSDISSHSVIPTDVGITADPEHGPAMNGQTNLDLDEDAMLYREGRDLLGKNSGALITKLKRAKGVQGARVVLSTAKRKADPSAYVAAAASKTTDQAQKDREMQQRLDEVFGPTQPITVEGKVS